MSVGLCLRVCATAARAAASISSDRLAGLNGRRLDPASLLSLASTDRSLSCNLARLGFDVDIEAEERLSRILDVRKWVPVVDVGVCAVKSSASASSSKGPSAFSRSVSEPEAFEMDSARFLEREDDPVELDDEGTGERRLRIVVGEGVESREPEDIDASLSRT